MYPIMSIISSLLHAHILFYVYIQGVSSICSLTPLSVHVDQRLRFALGNLTHKSKIVVKHNDRHITRHMAKAVCMTINLMHILDRSRNTFNQVAKKLAASFANIPYLPV